MLQNFPMVDPAAVRSVVALSIGRVGDLLIATGFLRSLQRHLPKARIRLVVASQAADAAAIVPFVDDVVEIHRFHRVATNVKAAAALAVSPQDLLLDLHPDPS